jgi:hypothetical protein
MTLAQKKARENFKKAIAYRKKTGCSLKQAFAYVKGDKKVGATKIIERGEKKSAKVTKVLQRVRTKKGTFKGMKKVSGVKKVVAKRKPTSSHKDTRSHNVNIRVVSGVNDAAINEIKHINDMLKKWKVVLMSLEQQKKLEKNSLNKTLIKKDIYRVKNVISDFKINLNRLKKHIK